MSLVLSLTLEDILLVRHVTIFYMEMKFLHLLAVVCILSAAEAGVLKCRLCNRASQLGDCNKLVTCDDTLEECYMEEVITEQLTIVYNGGCRSKDVCARNVGKKKKSSLISCSQCCASEADCNKRLCSIPDNTLNSSQCYSCDGRSLFQSAVRDPARCVTLTTCQPNEVCYSREENLAGLSTFYYGCERKTLCQVLVHQVLMQIDRCQTSPSLCHKRDTTICNTCCADGGCNYGTCQEMNQRMYALWKHGRFNLTTLKAQ